MSKLNGDCADSQSDDGAVLVAWRDSGAGYTVHVAPSVEVFGPYHIADFRAYQNGRYMAPLIRNSENSPPLDPRDQKFQDGSGAGEFAQRPNGWWWRDGRC